MRKNITPKIRFSVLERDGFCCKYCGRKPPNVQLEIDHITPVNNGGGNELENLITSCFDCNRGKGKDNIGEDNKNLYKAKISNIISKLKNYFYFEWNKNILGTMDNKTRTMLSLYINQEVKGVDGLKYKDYFSEYEYYGLDTRPDDVKKWEEENKDIWNNKFLLGGEYCDLILDNIYQENKEYIIESILKDFVLDDNEWTKKGFYNERLNYELTSKWSGDFYIISKYTLFPNKYKQNG